MPYIRTTTSKKLSEKSEQALKEQLGQAIALIPGKSEAWLMLSFHDNADMFFKGNGSEDYAFVEVALFGSASDAAYDRLTGAICDIVSSELAIDIGNIYVKYEESEHWGWNGRNF